MERLSKIGVHYERTARHVQQESAPLHELQSFRVDHAGVFRRQLTVERHKVRSGEQLLHLHPRETVPLRCIAVVDIVRHHAHSERVCQLTGPSADSPKTDDSHGPACEFNLRRQPVAEVFAAGPAAGRHILAVRLGLSGESE